MGEGSQLETLEKTRKETMQSLGPPCIRKSPGKGWERKCPEVWRSETQV